MDIELLALSTALRVEHLTSIILFHLYLDVRLIEGKFPEVMVNGEWFPICGHYFWNDIYGASLFCQRLDSKYSSGITTERRDLPLERDGILIGQCCSNDIDLLSCGCGTNTYLEQTSFYNVKCTAGDPSTVEIECIEPTTPQGINP